jgi:hypothetical protein
VPQPWGAHTPPTTTTLIGHLVFLPEMRTIPLLKTEQ